MGTFGIKLYLVVILTALVHECYGEFYWKSAEESQGWTPQARGMICAANSDECTWPPKNYKLYPNMGYYKFHNYGADWMTAKEMCEREGSHLTIINSEKESMIMRDLYANCPSPIYQYGWIGAREEEYRQYVTIFDGPLLDTGFTRWSPGEPNRPGTSALSVHFVDGGLDDGPRGGKRPFVCEIELSQVEMRRQWLREATHH